MSYSLSIHPEGRLGGSRALASAEWAAIHLRVRGVVWSEFLTHLETSLSFTVIKVDIIIFLKRKGERRLF